MADDVLDFQDYSLTEQLRAQRQKSLDSSRLAIQNAIQQNEEQAGRILSVQKFTGLPGEVIAGDIENLEKQILADSFDYQKYIDSSPHWTGYAAENPNHLAVLRNDAENLTGWEGLMEQVGLRAPGLAWDSGWAQIKLSKLISKEMTVGEGNLTPGEYDEIKELEKWMVGHNFGADNPFTNFLVETNKMVPMTLNSLWAAKEEALFGGVAAMGSAAAFGLTGPQAVAAPVTLPAAFGTGFTVGLTTGAAFESFEVERGLFMHEMTGMGLSMEEARNAANTVGVLNASLETLGFTRILKYIPGFKQAFASIGKVTVKEVLTAPTFRAARRQFAMRYGETLGTEVVTEVLQETTNFLAAEWLKQEKRDAGDLRPEYMAGTLDDWIEQSIEIATKTLQGAALITSIGPSMNYMQDRRSVASAQNNQAYFAAIQNIATDSKTKKEHPAQWKEILERIAERGPVKFIRVNVKAFRTYWQDQGIDPDAIAKELKVNLAKMVEGQEDLLIPIAEFGEKIAGTKHLSGLKDDMKFYEDEFTHNEAMDWMEKKDEHIARLEGALSKEFNRTMDDGVYEDLLGQLIGAGISRQGAEKQAKLTALIFTTMGARSGVDPMTLYKQRLASVQGEVPAVLTAPESLDMQLDPLLDRLRAGRTPTPRDIFGKSLIDFIVERGGLEPDSELTARDFLPQMQSEGRLGAVRIGGDTLDGMAEAAVEAGYIAERDPNVLLEVS